MTQQVKISVPPTSKTGLSGLFLRGGHEGWMSSQRQSFEHSTGTEQISCHFSFFQLEVHGPRGATSASLWGVYQAEEAKTALSSKVSKTLPGGTVTSDGSSLAPWMTHTAGERELPWLLPGTVGSVCQGAPSHTWRKGNQREGKPPEWLVCRAAIQNLAHLFNENAQNTAFLCLCHFYHENVVWETQRHNCGHPLCP